MSKITTGLVLVTTRENIGPTPHADRGSVVMTIENHPVLAQTIHVRGLDFLVPVTPDRQGILVICHQENDVGFVTRLRDQRGQKNGRKEEQRNPHSALMPHSA